MLKRVLFTVIPTCLLILNFIIHPASVRAQEGETETPEPTATATPIPCAKGDAYATAQVLDKARDAYIEELGTSPGLGCAVTGLETLPKPSDIIRKNIELADYDTAWTELQNAIKINPEDQSLNALVKDYWLWGFLYKLKAFFSSFIGILAAFIIFILIGALIRRRNRKPKLDIDKFDASILGSDKAESFASEIQTRFEEAIGNQGLLRNIERPDLVDGPMDPLTPPDIGLPDQFNKYFAVLFNLLQSKVVAVSGILTKDKEKGFGIIIKLVESGNKKTWGTGSIWESEVIPGFNINETAEPDDNCDSYRALSRYTAVLAHWLYYQNIDPNGLQRAFGTKNYISHIFTRIATELQEKDPENPYTESLLRRALVEDNKNIVAMLNLGTFIARSSPEESRKILTRVVNETESSEDHLMLLHIKANYRLGANILENLITEKPGENTSITCLRDAYEHALVYAEKYPDTAKDLIDMIVIPYTYALKREKKTDHQLEERIRTIENDLFPSPRTLYNLACYYSGEITLDLDRALVCLERSLKINHNNFLQAESDPSLKRLRETREEYNSQIKQRFGKTNRQ